MRSFFIPLLALSLLCLAGCTSAPATAESSHAGKLTAISGQFPVLEKGMSGEIVRQKLGNPAETQPMDSPEGKAEVWIYYIEKTVGMTQVATSTRGVPAFTVTPGGVDTTTVQMPVYTLREDKAVVTLSLLMFNNHLAALKAKVEDSSDYK